MFITRFEELPKEMQNSAVKEYAVLLSGKKGTLLAKRILEFLLCGLVFLITLPLFLAIAAGVGLTSEGPVFFRQERVGRDMKPFFILKFRTMIKDADRQGIQLTTGNDSRITGFGRLLRKTNLDEMPQILNVLKGEMSIIGTRPEVRRYVAHYTDEMYATLLLAPGMLSDASVKYKDENSLLTGVENPQEIYLRKILPDKMRYNLAYLKNISVNTDIHIIFNSICCAFSREKKETEK